MLDNNNFTIEANKLIAELKETQGLYSSKQIAKLEKIAVTNQKGFIKKYLKIIGVSPYDLLNVVYKVI